MYVCLHVCVRVCICVNTCECACTNLFKCVLMCVCVFVYEYNVYTCVYLCLRMSTYVCLCVSIYLCEYMRMCMAGPMWSSGQPSEPSTARPAKIFKRLNLFQVIEQKGCVTSAVSATSAAPIQTTLHSHFIERFGGRMVRASASVTVDLGFDCGRGRVKPKI